MYLFNDELLESLPFRITLPDGLTRTSLHELSGEELVSIGVLPCKVIKPEITWTQYYGEPEIAVGKDSAIVTYPVIDYTAEEIAEILKSAREVKVAEIQQASDSLFVALHEGYTLGEVASFDRQKSGARDILSGKLESEDALYVASLASVRQAGGDKMIDPTGLAKKIMANATAAEQATVMLLGHQQGLEVLAREANTLEELEAIVW